MKNRVLVFAFVVLLASPIWAQKQSKISVVIDGLGCSTPAGPGSFSALSWSFGASLPVTSATGSGGSADKPSVSELSLTKAFDACSPALFGGVVTGKHFNTLALTQTEKKDSDYMIVTLSQVMVSAYQISGMQSQEDPMESISVNFGKICIYESSSGNKLCYSPQTNTAN
jgi:type VI protein secretion system component Hcp